MRVIIVVAVAENGAIGKNNALLWRLPDDLKFFKAITMGKPVIMGRKTYDSIGKPLPGRRNIVVSRQANLSIDGCDIAPSIQAALNLVSDAAEVAVIGGADIYRQVLSFTNTIYLTRVHAKFDADVFFPEIAASEWREIQRQDHTIDERHSYPFSFVTLERRGGPATSQLATSG